MADDKIVRRRGTIVAIVLVLLSLLPLYDQYGHPARVIDGATGEALEGAFAVSLWVAGTGLGHGGRLCYKLAVARSGANGMLFMPQWSWSARAIVLDHYGPFFSGGGYFLYRPGYYEGPMEANAPGQRIMWRDPRTGMERLNAISFDQRRGECVGVGRKEGIVQLGPVFDAMLQEAEGLANTPTERIERERIRFWRNELLFGAKVAAEVSRQQRAKEESK
ncbi:MAG: hypothetical protein F9K47_18450 [Burkholderiales bacterium]|nr:MAG: hypothetical protein F9K47_18450 [Burkholderiales bacterium]